MICANCEHAFDSKFCPACGQKADIHRVKIKTVVHDFLHAFTHADKGFLLLVKELVTKPGIVAREFMEGRRKRYFNPLSFLVITSAVFAYIDDTTGYMEALTGGSQGTDSARVSPQMREVFEIVRTSGKTLTLFLIAPLFALLSWLFFIRSKYNYAENFVLNAFLFGEAMIFRIVFFIPVHVIFPEYTARITWFFYEPVFLLYMIVAFRQFYRQNLFLTIIKAIFIRVLFVVLFWFLILGFVHVKNMLT
jgi:hypothetical protein